MQGAVERRIEPPRLLLVERNSSSAAALAAGLEASAPGFIVTAVSDGRQALSLLRAQSFDVVLFDLASLDDVAASPDEAVSRLIKLAEGALAVALSGDASVSAALEVMRLGGHDCVSRQTDPAALARQLASLARRHGKPRVLSFVGATGIPALTNGDMPPLRASNVALRAPAVLPMWRQEQRIIEEAISSFSGNVALAAAALELSPSTIYRKRQAWAEMDGKRGAA